MALTKGEARRLAQNAKVSGPCIHNITFIQGQRERGGIVYHTICFNCRQVLAERQENVGRTRQGG